ncbi:polymorphic toxin type 15 domain-containing protein [Priestia aryabhattai]|nr:polymorphic toxin type 15 domain-containing protein [Priestia aryabhattai]
MGQSLTTKGTEKLNNMRNTLRTSAVANVTKQAYQSVKNAPASWTQSLHKTYNNILDSSMPRLGPELVPAGPALAQQTVRETLQNVKQQTMQMIEKPVKAERVSERQIQQDTGEVKHLDNIPRTKEIEVKFNYKTKFDSEEFARQLKDQEKGMNELTVHEYQENRERFNDKGRAKEGNAAQKIARQKAYAQKVNELQGEGITLSQAKKKAQEWLDTQAALHNPDQIAGGKAEIIGGMGDKRVNFSIGSQWRSRIKIVDKQIEEMANNMTTEQLKNTYLNVKLTH